MENHLTSNYILIIQSSSGFSHMSTHTLLYEDNTVPESLESEISFRRYPFSSEKDGYKSFQNTAINIKIFHFKEIIHVTYTKNKGYNVCLRCR